jgi:hypothetical protein
MSVPDPATAEENARRPSQLHYRGWRVHHRSARRFYVGGFDWFCEMAGTDEVKYLSGLVRAARAAMNEKGNAQWLTQFREIDDALAPQQFALAKKTQPMFFHKAFGVLVTCEIALREKQAEGRADAALESPLQVYSRMRVISACWNIDMMNSNCLSRLESASPGAIDEVAAKVGQDPQVLWDMGEGHTVTYQTATAIKKVLDEDYGKYVRVGVVRPRPGKDLGTLDASPHETVWAN